MLLVLLAVNIAEQEEGELVAVIRLRVLLASTLSIRSLLEQEAPALVLGKARREVTLFLQLPLPRVAALLIRQLQTVQALAEDLEVGVQQVTPQLLLVVLAHLVKVIAVAQLQHLLEVVAVVAQERLALTL